MWTVALVTMAFHNVVQIDVRPWTTELSRVHVYRRDGDRCTDERIGHSRSRRNASSTPYFEAHVRGNASDAPACFRLHDGTFGLEHDLVLLNSTNFTSRALGVDFGTTDDGVGLPLAGQTRTAEFDPRAIDPCVCVRDRQLVNPLCVDERTCAVSITDATIAMLISVLRLDPTLLGPESNRVRARKCIASLRPPHDQLTVDDAVDFLRTRLRLQLPASLAACAR